MENYQPRASKLDRGNQEIWNLVGNSPVLIGLRALSENAKSLCDTIDGLCVDIENIAQARSFLFYQIIVFECWAYDRLAEKHDKPSNELPRHMPDATQAKGDSWEALAFHYSPALVEDTESVLVR